MHLYLLECFKIHRKTSKTPLRLCQDRQPIDLVDTVETAAIALQILQLNYVCMFGLSP